ncbi:MAG: DUF4148 domain-containing protein, partial [Delftia acidovorans]
MAQNRLSPSSLIAALATVAALALP